MTVDCCTFKEFANTISGHNSRIVLFGAGAIGSVTTPEILKSYDLLERVVCCLDNDLNKCGNYLKFFGKKVEIKPPAYLETCPENTVILLNISRFAPVLTQLAAMECTRNMVCFIMPMLLIHNFCRFESRGTPEWTDTPLIPKKIHYMWLGGKQFPVTLKKCMASWKRYCPDYEIVEWNENNYDIGRHSYMKQAYEAGAYGFVPDYARLDILYREGGLYLDTDVELFQNIDDLLYQNAFCGVEKWQLINFGGLSGAVKGHPMIKKFLDARADVRFLNANGTQNKGTCGYYDTRVAIDEGYKINGETQSIKGMNIFAFDYFHPFDYMSGTINETRNTHSVHWFNGSWLDEKMKKANRKSKKQYLELYESALKRP